MARGSSSNSPLADPKTLIHRLAVDIQEFIHLPDPSPFYVSMATVAANMIGGGHPVWVMLIGPGGAGKTAAIRAIEKIPGVHPEGALESKRALLSGVGKKDRASGATGGILLALGQRGLLALGDFTNTMSQSVQELKETVGALRDIADGEYKRSLGTDGGKPFIWTGHIGFLGASTPEIDDHAVTIGRLGQRWIFYRYGFTDGYHETWKALSLSDRGLAARAIQRLVREFFESLCMEFSCYNPCFKLQHVAGHKCIAGPPRREITEKEKIRFIGWATLTARCRSIVPREERTYERTNTPDLEPPMRLGESMAQLYLGMEMIGLPDDERWKLIEKVAWDSITPRLRGQLVRELYIRSEHGWDAARISTGEAEEMLNVGLAAARRTVEDLQVLGVLERADKKGSRAGAEGNPHKIGLTEWTMEVMERCRRK
jgi:hypothetical protein